MTQETVGFGKYRGSLVSEKIKFREFLFVLFGAFFSNLSPIYNSGNSTCLTGIFYYLFKRTEKFSCWEK